MCCCTLTGRHHLLFSLSDYSVLPYAFEIQVVPGGSLETYRENVDVSFPLYYQHKQDYEPRMMEPGSSRQFFLTFKGHRYVATNETYGVWVRDQLRYLHRPPSMIVLTKCLAHHDDDDCAGDEARYDDYSFGDLINTTFGLAPRGYGPTSYRLIELLSLNVIPVILQDRTILPFGEWLDWSEFSVLVPERSVGSIPYLLRSISREKVRRMQERGKEVYLRHFRDREAQLLTLIATLKARFRAVAKLQQAM